MKNKEDVIKLLSDVPGDRCFWCSSGQVFRNLNDLAAGFESMSEDTYKSHANKDKNDFKNWVTDIIGDKKLAMELLKARSKKSAAEKVKKRVAELKKKKVK